MDKFVWQYLMKCPGSPHLKQFFSNPGAEAAGAVRASKLVTVAVGLTGGLSQQVTLEPRPWSPKLPPCWLFCFRSLAAAKLAFFSLLFYRSQPMLRGTTDLIC